MVKHHVNGAVWQTLSPLDLINGKEHTKHTACYSLLFVIVLSRYQGLRNHEP